MGIPFLELFQIRTYPSFKSNKTLHFEAAQLIDEIWVISNRFAFLSSHHIIILISIENGC
jgi:hypothetical protein